MSKLLVIEDNFDLQELFIKTLQKITIIHLVQKAQNRHSSCWKQSILI